MSCLPFSAMRSPRSLRDIRIAGCASGSWRTDTTANANGTYKFSQRISDAIPPVMLEGFIIVAGREVEVQMNGINCRLDQRSTRTSALFDCEAAMIRVDRGSPQTQTSYTVETTRRRPVRECVQYSTTLAGERVCVRWGTRYEESLGTLTGPLRLVLVPG